MAADAEKYRLITRSDFDGLVCAMLLKELNMLDDIRFVHPKDVQDGKIEVSDHDILTNLPYAPGCHLCFDHHVSEENRRKGSSPANHILDPDAASAARVLYDHYGGQARFPGLRLDMLSAVDKADSAQFTQEEILNPTGWVLLSFLMDPRTGLGRFRDFRVSNYDLMLDLIDYCKHHDIDEILALPDVAERVSVYESHREDFREQIRASTRVHDKVVVLDLRQSETIYCGNRFMIYALFPQCNASIHVIWGLKKQNTVLAVGKSILNRTNPVDIGKFLLDYSGGGHAAAGTCQVPHEQAERVLQELIVKLNAEPILCEEPASLSGTQA